MSNLRQAAQQAIEELANARDHIYLLPENAQAMTEAEMLDRLDAVITVLRAAIAKSVGGIPPSTPGSATRSADSAESFGKPEKPPRGRDPED